MLGLGGVMLLGCLVCVHMKKKKTSQNTFCNTFDISHVERKKYASQLISVCPGGEQWALVFVFYMASTCRMGTPSVIDTLQTDKKKWEPGTLIPTLFGQNSANKIEIQKSTGMFRTLNLETCCKILIFNKKFDKILVAAKKKIFSSTKFRKFRQKTSQELRMLSLSLFIQGWLWMFRLLFSIVRYVTSVSKVTGLWDCSLGVFLQLSLSLSFSLYLSLSLSLSLSVCWSGHVSSFLWSNVSKVISL